ncbi:MAG: methyl-accepting chemotaxis protein [Candidatus Nitrospinota bacterium M3_3B_026]
MKRKSLTINQLVTGGPILLLVCLSVVLGGAHYKSSQDAAYRHMLELSRVGARPILNLMKSAVGGGNYAIALDDEALALYRANADLLFFSVEGKTDLKGEPFGVVYDGGRGKAFRSRADSGRVKELEEKIAKAKDAVSGLPPGDAKRERIEKIAARLKDELSGLLGDMKTVETLKGEYQRPPDSVFTDGSYLDNEKWRLHLVLPTGNKGGGSMWMVLDAAAMGDVWKKTLWQVAPINLATLLVLAALAWLLSRKIIAPIHTMRGAIEQIERDSDLTRRVSMDSDNEIGKTSAAFDRMLDKFQGMIAGVAAATGEIVTATKEMAGISDRVSESNRKQQDDTEQVAGSINEMSASIEQVASAAEEAKGSAAGAMDKARGGRQTVSDTAGAMNDLAAAVRGASEVMKSLEAHTNDVGMVVNVINEIAFQTNLLALNASVEAARAGKHGKGFAVVAEEVRALAQRTQKSTREIEDLVEKLQAEAAKAAAAMRDGSGKAEDGVKLSDKADEALKVITEAVEAITTMSAQIASAAEQQASAANSINVNVSSINEMSDETASASEKARASSERLAELARELGERIALFKV